MDEEFYIAESLKVDKEGILFLADLWEKIESFSGGKVLLHFDEVKDIDANLSAALGAILDSATKKGTSMFLNAPREKTVKRALARIGFLGAFSVQTNVKERENFIMYKCFDTNIYKKKEVVQIERPRNDLCVLLCDRTQIR